MADLTGIQSIISQTPDPSKIQEKALNGVKKADTNTEEPGFAEVITDFLSSVKDKQAIAKEKTNAVIQGESQDLLAAKTAMEESQLSFQLLLEIRNKLLDSYKEVQRMQI